MIGCCWPPQEGGGGGPLAIGAPVVGGIVGDFLKVGAGGFLDQSVVPGGMAIGGAIAGSVATQVLFVGAGGLLAQDAGFTYDLALNAIHADSIFAVNRRLTDGAFVESFGTGGAGLAPLFRASIVNLFVNPGGLAGIPDPEVTYGFNIAQGGGLIDPAFGGIGITMEGYFDNGVTKIQELRLVTVPRPGSGHPAVRVVSIGGNQENGAVTLGLAASPGSLKWFDDLGNQQGVLLGGINITGGGLRSSTYGDALLMQLNSAATVHTNLLVYANGFVDGQPDRLSIGSGGAVSRVQTYKGLDVYASGYLLEPALTVQTFTGPTVDRLELDVDQINPDGVVSRHPGAWFARCGVGQQSAIYVNQSGSDPGTVWEQVMTAPPAGPLDLSTFGVTAAQLKLQKTAIVPIGALARFKISDETGAVFYLTGQAA